MKALVTVLALAGVYLLVLASGHPLDVAAALVVGALVTALLGRQLLPRGGGSVPGLARRALAFPRFAAAVVAEIVVGTWRVALIVLRVRPLREPGIVLVPLGERSDVGVAVSALAITLSPGELLVDVDEERRAMLIHVLDASDPDAVRRHYAEFYERYQRPVFP